jgi:hypothetical protein
MNLQSTAFQHMPHMRIHKLQFHWFKKNKGKARKTRVLPILSDEHKENRVLHPQELLELQQRGEVMAYLDEKYFLCFSGHKLAKHLRRAEFEEDGIDRIRVRRVMNKLHPVKGSYNILHS